MMAPTHMSMMTKTHHFECCMCGDLGLSHLLFRCAVCHFRSQHRYCSNLYPKAESYKVCNWCLINKDNANDHQQINNLTISSLNNSDNKKLKQAINHHNGGPNPKWLQPTSPIKKPAIRPPSDQSKSPPGRKRITATSDQAQDQEERIVRSSSSASILRRSKSASSINIKMVKKNSSDDDNKRLSEDVNISKRSGSGGEASGGPTTNVIKHVFRNKVRRYKLLDEVSC